MINEKIRNLPKWLMLSACQGSARDEGFYWIPDYTGGSNKMAETRDSTPTEDASLSSGDEGSLNKRPRFNDTKASVPNQVTEDASPFSDPWVEGHRPGVAQRRRSSFYNLLVSQSTVPGYVSYRDHHEGTWYIQELGKALREFHRSKHLLEILDIADERVSRRATEEGYHQCPSTTKHVFLKKIYFQKKTGYKNYNTY